MKYAVYLLCLIGLIACKGKPATLRADSIIEDSTVPAKPVENSVSDSSTNNSTSFTPQIAEKNVIAFAVLPNNYSIIDTGEYSTGVMDGSYVIVKNNDGFVDTIDRGFGIQELNTNQNIYLKLTHAGDGSEDEPVGKPHRFLTLTEKYLMSENNKKTLLEKLLFDFDDFSSPFVINNKVYYWSIKRSTSPLYKIMAVEYDPITKKYQSHFLFKDGVETDDTGYFSAPYLQGDTIHYYYTDKQQWKFSPSFKPYN